MRFVMAVCLCLLASWSTAMSQQAKVDVKITSSYLDIQGGNVGITTEGTATLPQAPYAGSTWHVIVTYSVTVDEFTINFGFTTQAWPWGAAGNVTWSGFDFIPNLPEGTYTVTAQLVLNQTVKATTSTTVVVFYG